MGLLATVAFGMASFYFANQRANSAELAQQKAEQALAKTTAAEQRIQQAERRIQSMVETLNAVDTRTSELKLEQSRRDKIEDLYSLAIEGASRAAFRELQRLSRSDTSSHIRAYASQKVTSVKTSYPLDRSTAVPQPDMRLLPKSLSPCDARSFLNNENPDLRMAALQRLREASGPEFPLESLKMYERETDLKVLHRIANILLRESILAIEGSSSIDLDVAILRRQVHGVEPKCK